MRALRALLLALFCVSFAGAADLRTLKGDAVKGEVVSISDKEIVLNVEGKQKAVPVADVLSLDLGVPGKLPGDNRVIAVELTDGSVVHCSAFKAKGNQATFTVLLTNQEITTPLSAIANVLNDAQVEKNRKDWEERVAKKRRRDVVAVVKGEVVNSLEGTLGEGNETGEKIEFQPVVQGLPKTNVTIANVRGLIFQRTPNPQAAPVLFKLLDLQGNQLRVSAVASEGTHLLVTTPVGAKFTIPFAQLARLDYSTGKLAYLSDLKPTRQTLESASGERFVHLMKDKNLNGGPLRLMGSAFPKGLAMFTYTELEYTLKGDYEQFSAIVGFDDDVKGADGPVHLLIEGDGNQLLSMTLNREDKVKARPISLNIKDVNRLRIVVSDPAKTDIGKHLDLANAKVTK
jgi:hypothetical protein